VRNARDPQRDHGAHHQHGDAEHGIGVADEFDNKIDLHGGWAGQVEQCVAARQRV
jgi:hypothetical protein